MMTNSKKTDITYLSFEPRAKMRVNERDVIQTNIMIGGKLNIAI
jgi:hypothetical protein